MCPCVSPFTHRHQHKQQNETTSAQSSDHTRQEQSIINSPEASEQSVRVNPSAAEALYFAFMVTFGAKVWRVRSSEGKETTAQRNAHTGKCPR